MRPSLRLGKIAGVEIGVHYSWFAVLALVSWSLADGLLPEYFPGWAVGTYWVTGILAAFMLFGSVLVHELAHSLVAQARGFTVEGITLFFLGGASNVKADAKQARDEFFIAIVGPLTSLVLSGIFGIGLLVFMTSDVRDAASVWYLAMFDLGNTPAAAVVWYLAFINLLLAAFNLLPAFPLDGGRVLRSIIWATTGSHSKATRVAAFGGQAFGIALMGLGAFQFLVGNFLGGLWFALIGWFLHSSASSGRRGVVLESAVNGASVRDVLDANPITIDPDVPLSDAVYDYFLQRGARALPVCEGDILVGIITLTDVRSVPQDRWDIVMVKDEMTPAPLWQVSPDDDLLHAMALLGEHSIHQAPVLEGDRLVGLLSRAHIIKYFHRRRGLGLG